VKAVTKNKWRTDARFPEASRPASRANAAIAVALTTTDAGNEFPTARTASLMIGVMSVSFVVAPVQPPASGDDQCSHHCGDAEEIPEIVVL
jgi:hypothetical protein